MKLRRCCGLLLLFPFLLAACSKEGQQNVETAPSGPATLSAAPGDASSAANAKQIAATLSDLTQAVRKYGAEKQRVPKDLNEVVSAGYLPSIPAAPAGKKFAIDKQMQVYLADQ